MAQPEIYLTCDDMAEILGLTPKTIYNRLSLMKNHKTTVPDLLPPVSRVPRTKGPRWSPEVVAAWQRKYNPLPANDAGHAKRGRPTKAEQVRKRLSQSVANH